MTGKHWSPRQPRRCAKKMVLVAILVPFLLVGCVTLEKARNWFHTAAEVCDIIHKIKEHCNDRK